MAVEVCYNKECCR